jgi:hypothetical protein
MALKLIGMLFASGRKRPFFGSSGKFVLFIASAGMTWGHGRDIIA